MARSKAELERVIREAREELSGQEVAEARAVNAALVGKCFAYRNCYSCPQGSEDYWTMYARVEGLDEYGNLVILKFQTDKNGLFDLDPKHYTGAVSMGGYREIPAAEFEQKAREAAEYVRGLLLKE